MIEYTENIDMVVDQLLKWNKFNVILGTAPPYLLTYTCSHTQKMLEKHAPICNDHESLSAIEPAIC